MRCPPTAPPHTSHSDDTGSQAPEAEPTTTPSARDAALDEWAFSNDPTRFRVPLETRYDKLASSGIAEPRPWADTYWPTYQDGVNARWQKTGDFLTDLSPAEKFDAAFNGWNPQRVKGLRPYKAEHGSFDKDFDQSYYRKLGPFARDCSMRYGNRVTREAAAAGLLRPDGTAKSGNSKEDYGGIETWFGLCHAWAPVAILEPEPLKAVEHNGIRFEVSDIKALLIACYNQVAAILIGRRNEERDIALDGRGRAEKADARDINPGAFHLCLANLIGRDKRSFCEDRTANYEVWNQPIREYRVTFSEEVNKRQAINLVRMAGLRYRYNKEATRFQHVRCEVDYITESHAGTQPNAHDDTWERTDPYEYLLELDAEGNIIGGEWLATSRTEHPDFLWLPLHAGSPLSPYVSLDEVRTLLEKSRQDVPDRSDKVDVTWSARLDAGEVEQLGVIDVAEGGVLEFAMSGRGDMDAYARFGADPVIRGDGDQGDFDLLMYAEGSNERATLKVKKGDKVHVAMRGYEDRSNATLVIRQL
ncbi:MAG: hypothetical protein AAF799_01870 [Myxococcota bacterium]